MKVQLHNCCNTRLMQMISHNFSFVGKTAILSPEECDSMFLQNTGIYLALHGITTHKHSTVIFTTKRPSNFFCVLVSKNLFV